MRTSAQLPRGQAPSVAGLAREQRERLGLQRIAGEDRDAVAVHDVQRRPSAAQRVVVHRRQIVVNQRVGVNELDGAAPRSASAWRLARDRVDDRVGGGERRACGRRRLPPAKTL